MRVLTLVQAGVVPEFTDPEMVQTRTVRPESVIHSVLGTLSLVSRPRDFTQMQKTGPALQRNKMLENNLLS